ncbi:MAG: hypothetical protein HFG54_07550 [Lachnospiraceae bacterium]|nr:hypothetical protein [Lachnospiraceae bacterium]
MGIKYDEIAKEIISLYCENKPEKIPNCINEECQSGRCLCIDEEQIRLVSFFAGFSYDISLKDSQMIIGSREELDEAAFCKDQKEFTRRLIFCKGRNPNELENLIAKNKKYLKDQEFLKIIKTLPLIQSINALYPVEERGTISYLCLYGNEAGGFFKGLLSEMVCQMIDEFIASQSSEELLYAAERIFGTIIRIYKGEKSEEFETTFSANILNYIDSYKQEEQSLALVAFYLRKYYNELEAWRTKKAKSQDAFSFILENALTEKADILHIYQIFREMIVITGLSSNKIVDGFFKKAAKNIDSHSIYSKIEHILKNFSKYNGNKKYKILTVLKSMLSEEDGMCDEALIELEEFLSGA